MNSQASRDHLQKRAIQLLSQHVRLLKAAKRAQTHTERKALALKAGDAAIDAHRALAEFDKASGRPVQP